MLNRLMGLIALTFVFATSAGAETRLSLDLGLKTEHYEFRDSRILAVRGGGALSLFFEKPAPDLERIGVAAGMPLFEGNLDDDGTIRGTAYLYHDACERTRFDVTGSYMLFGRAIGLRGAVPIVDPVTCRIRGWSGELPTDPMNLVRID